MAPYRGTVTAFGAVRGHRIGALGGHKIQMGLSLQMNPSEVWPCCCFGKSCQTAEQSYAAHSTVICPLLLSIFINTGAAERCTSLAPYSDWVAPYQDNEAPYGVREMAPIADSSEHVFSKSRLAWNLDSFLVKWYHKIMLERWRIVWKYPYTDQNMF